MTRELSKATSLRLRIGVSLILLWWLPIWALAPAIQDAMKAAGVSDPPSTATITTVLVIVQTLIGGLGCWIAGKEMVPLIKGQPRKQALGNIWFALIHGSLPETAEKKPLA